MSGNPRVTAVRALVPASQGGADYHAQSGDHWITGKIATPMSRWPEYRATRSSWGIGALGSFVVEIETSDGHVGFAPSTGGLPAAYLVEQHLARFVEGRALTREDIAEAWDQMFAASLYYGRRGLAMHAISAIDLALWDALGRSREQPVWSLLGDRAIRRLPCYATGPRPDVARELGFVGGKLPLPAGPSEGEAGLAVNVDLAARMRRACGSPDDFFLAYDCYMSLDVPYTLRLAEALRPYELRWLEEFLPPDDYWGYAEVHGALSPWMQTTTGEHESTRWGFRLLLEMGCADIVQPDVGWCGGLTELLRIAELADGHGVPVVPHGSSVYSYHFATTRADTPFVEFLMMHHDATEVIPMFSPLLTDEPVPVDGHLEVPDRPGFGVELNREVSFDRPFPHSPGSQERTGRE